MEWFKSYPNKYISDEKISELSLEEEAAYNRLLHYLYKYDGEYEENVDKLRIIFRVFHRKKAFILWSSIRHLFEITDNVIRHSQVTKQMERFMSQRVKLSNGGRKGGIETQARLKAGLSIKNIELRTKNTEQQNKEETVVGISSSEERNPKWILAAHDIMNSFRLRCPNATQPTEDQAYQVIVLCQTLNAEYGTAAARQPYGSWTVKEAIGKCNGGTASWGGVVYNLKMILPQIKTEAV